jgi:hypothetical protein
MKALSTKEPDGETAKNLIIIKKDSRRPQILTRKAENMTLTAADSHYVAVHRRN